MSISTVSANLTGLPIGTAQPAASSERNPAEEARESAAERAAEGDTSATLPAAGAGKGANVDTSA
jgi:hypothetical protein